LWFWREQADPIAGSLGGDLRLERREGVADGAILGGILKGQRLQGSQLGDGLIGAGAGGCGAKVARGWTSTRRPG
jgi:hypothetical protein